MKKIASIVLMGMILGLGVEGVNAWSRESDKSAVNAWSRDSDESGSRAQLQERDGTYSEVSNPTGVFRQPSSFQARKAARLHEAGYSGFLHSHINKL